MTETPEQQLDRLRAAARIVVQVHTREDYREGEPFVIEIGASGGFHNRACIPTEEWIKAWGIVRELVGLDPPPTGPTPP